MTKKLYDNTKQFILITILITNEYVTNHILNSDLEGFFLLLMWFDKKSPFPFLINSIILELLQSKAEDIVLLYIY